MHLRRQHILGLLHTKRAWILILCAVALVVGGYMAIDHQRPNHLEKQDQAKVTRDMASAYAYLQQKVQPLGITLSQPAATTCGVGDPSLYAFTCATKSSVTFQTGAHATNDPDLLSQRLLAFDKQLRADGWQYGSNDFRHQAKQPYSNWAYLMRTHGAYIHYTKDTCDFEASLPTPHAQQNNREVGDFFCAISDGPPTQL